MVVRALPVVDNLDKRRIESGKFEREQLKLLGHSKGTGVRWQIITKTKKVCLKRCKRPETKRRSETTMRPQDEVEETGGKNGMKGAYRIALSRPELTKALDELKGNFWAASSQASRQIKRNEALRMASLVAEDRQAPSLDARNSGRSCRLPEKFRYEVW